MKNYLLVFTAFYFILNSTRAETTIDVVENTIKIGATKEEVFYYGFAEGDQIIFNFEEINGKELKEVEILEYPSSSKFSEFKTTKIENKTIVVSQKAIYKFRFYNSSISGRVCKIKIQRIPANEETKKFNTNVKWVIKQDTVWNSYTKDVLVRYDTIRKTKTKKELVKTDTIITNLVDRVEKVHSYGYSFSSADQYSYIHVSLPKNTYTPNALNPYESTEVLAWSYYIGVLDNSNSQQLYEKANKNIGNVFKGVMALCGYGALAQLAVSGVSLFTPPNNGENIQYWIKASMNDVTYTYDNGDVISSASRNDKIKQGSFTIQLYNDNLKLGLNVDVKVVCVQIKKTFADIPYEVVSTDPVYEKKIFNEPKITSQKVPVLD